MIKTTKSFETSANTLVARELKKLTSLANLAVISDDIFDQTILDCEITEEELDAILLGNIKDMSVCDYYKLYSYLNEILQYQKGHSEINKDECESFIDDVNEQLTENDKLDKEEAVEANETFNKDKIIEEYNNAAKEANIELFETSDNLATFNLDKLKYLIYKNGWQKEFDTSLLNDRQSVISFLYHKLEQKIAEKVYELNGLKKEDVKVEDNVKKREKKNSTIDVANDNPFADLCKIIFGNE